MSNPNHLILKIVLGIIGLVVFVVGVLLAIRAWKKGDIQKFCDSCKSKLNTNKA
jgi:hypothetical protein